jgi:hypothetical protein
LAQGGREFHLWSRLQRAVERSRGEIDQLRVNLGA